MCGFLLARESIGEGMPRPSDTQQRPDAGLWPAKISTTVTQHRPRGCTGGEVRSIRGTSPLDLIGRNNASGVGAAWGDSKPDREDRAPRKSAVGRDCNAVAKTAKLFEDALRIPG